MRIRDTIGSAPREGEVRCMEEGKMYGVIGVWGDRGYMIGYLIGGEIRLPSSARLI